MDNKEFPEIDESQMAIILTNILRRRLLRQVGKEPMRSTLFTQERADKYVSRRLYEIIDKDPANGALKNIINHTPFRDDNASITDLPYTRLRAFLFKNVH